jgi:hypothetical protein
VSAPRSEPFAGREAHCLPEFPDQDGWYGGDAAYSIPLPTADASTGVATSLWLFGDSFVERPDSLPGRHYPFVHNSIALAHCAADGQLGIEYFWGGGTNGKPVAFFEPDPEATWVRDFVAGGGRDAYYWLFDGFIAQDALFVGLLRVGDGAPRGPFRLPFELLGMDLARIENFHDPPEDWEIRISSLSESRVAFPGSAFVVREDFVYAFAFFDHGDGHAPRILGRLDVDALTDWKPDLAGDLETLSVHGEWVPGFVPEEGLILMDDDASEMSVHFDVVTDSWIAVYNVPGPPSNDARRAQVWLRRAPHLAGPWSARVPLLEIESTAIGASSNDGTDRNEDANVFCYAAKAHPQYSRPHQLLVTYVCNLFSRSSEEEVEILERLSVSPNLYRPKAYPAPMPTSAPITLESHTSIRMGMLDHPFTNSVLYCSISS